jgi:integrase
VTGSALSRNFTGGRLVDVKKAFSAARIDAKIPDFQLRDLRHSCATRLADQGEELVTVAEILGHTDIRMTKRYSHAMQERKRNALEKLVGVTLHVNLTPKARNMKNGRTRVLP